MPTVLITGAGRGLGLEFARQYAADGWKVLATVRSPDKAGKLSGVPGDIAILPLDAADPAAAAALGEHLIGVPIDLLINNAGVYGPRGVSFAQGAEGLVDVAAGRQALDTNILGPLLVTEALLPNLRAGSLRKIVTISSKVGSIADNSSGANYFYRASKAGVNAALHSVALDLAPEGFTVLLLHPGWVRTDMGGPSGLIDAPESIAGIRRVIDGAGPDRSGGFFNYDGTPLPW